MKTNNYEKGWSRFHQENYFSVNWANLLLSSNISTEKSCKTFLEKFESLLDTSSPLKQILKIN